MPTSSRRQNRSPLRVTVIGRGVVIDKPLRDHTDRAVRFKLARFGPAIRLVRVGYALDSTKQPVCTLQVSLVSSTKLVVQHHGLDDLALAGALRDAATQIARALESHSRERLRA